MNEEDQPSDLREDPEAPAQLAGPALQEREALIQSVQIQALARKQDPLAASLDLLCGDLMALAFRVKQTMDEETHAGPPGSSGFKGFERRAELLLKVARQIDRFAHLRRQVSPKAES